MMTIRRGLLLVALALGACAPQAPAAAPPQQPSANERSTDAKATRSQFTAVVRADSFLASLPEQERAQAISEPFAAGLVIVYMVDQRGVARPARSEDLSDSGVTRDALRAVAEWNVAAALPEALSCERDTVTALAAGSFYQSSRLLLDKQWSDLAAKKGQVIVAVPSNDTLFVACDATPATVKKLATTIQNTYPRAARPVSPSILRWTPSGWQGLNPPQ
ncbi:MAG TPA: DUF1444 family protein [Polyangiaceae bacterium]